MATLTDHDILSSAVLDTSESLNEALASHGLISVRSTKPGHKRIWDGRTCLGDFDCYGGWRLVHERRLAKPLALAA